MIFLWLHHMLFITLFLCLHFYLDHHNILLVWLLFLKFSWISIWNKCLFIFWASVFQLIFFCCLFIFLFNITEKLTLTYVKIFVYFSEAVFQLSSCCCLFIFCSTSLKSLSWFMLRFLFIFLTTSWNFHCNTHEQYCLLFFSHFTKHSTQITLSFSYYEIFIATYVNNVIYFLSIIFQNFLCRLIYFSDIVKLSLQHAWIMLFIFFFSFFKTFYMNHNVRIWLWWFVWQ